MSDQLVTETSAGQQTTQQTSIPPVGFEPTISAGKRPQTCALDCTATGTGFQRNVVHIQVVIQSDKNDGLTLEDECTVFV